MIKTYEEIKTRIQQSQKNVLCLHRRPDGDSLGSNLAFAAVIRSFGKEADIYCVDEVPDYLTFLKGSESVIVQAPDQIRWQNYDTFWALDMSAPDMLGKPVQFPPQLPIVVIDHHKTNIGWGKVNLVDEQVISTTAVLYEFFKTCSIEYDKDTAMAFLTGLVTDSGFFNHVMNGQPLVMAADLMDSFELNYQEIIFHIQKQLNIEDVLFMGNALSLMKVDYENKVALLPIPYKNWINFGKAGENNHLLTGYLSSINGTEFGILIIEEKPGQFRVQFRSRNREFDVGALAASLGGGGHKNASGATVIAESMDEAIKLIIEKL